jgi:hypothetical protein
MMKAQKSFIWGWAAVLVSAPGFVSVAWSQHAEQDQPVEIRVIPLENASAQAIMVALKHMSLKVNSATEPNTNSVILQGAPSALDQAVELISRLDVSTGGRVMGTRIFEIRHRNAESVAELAFQLVSGPRSRIAVDDVNQLVIVKGSDADIAACAELFERVDRPQLPLQLSFYFMEGRIGAGGSGGSGASENGFLPESLKPVADAMRENGFLDLKLRAPLTTRVQEGESFKLDGASGEVGAGHWIFELRGSAERAAPGESTRLEIRGDVESPDEERDLFSVETTLVAPFGEFVVLAATPSGGDSAIALVVRVDR